MENPELEGTQRILESSSWHRQTPKISPLEGARGEAVPLGRARAENEVHGNATG